ncbi:MAG: hypothetical protein ACXABY_00555 [Candidatus Thorarchaeota archaeon]|jgi:pantothenate kinase-related protein Tda10
MEELTITISGPTGVGKSVLGVVLYKYMKLLGYRVSFDEPAMLDLGRFTIEAHKLNRKRCKGLKVNITTERIPR